MGHDVEIVDEKGRVLDTIYFSRACHVERKTSSWEIWDVALLHGHTGRVILHQTNRALAKLAAMEHKPEIKDGQTAWTGNMNVFMFNITRFQKAAKKYPKCRFYSDQVWELTPYTMTSRKWDRKEIVEKGMYREHFVKKRDDDDDEEEEEKLEQKSFVIPLRHPKLGNVYL